MLPADSHKDLFLLLWSADESGSIAVHLGAQWELNTFNCFHYPTQWYPPTTSYLNKTYPLSTSLLLGTSFPVSMILWDYNFSLTFNNQAPHASRSGPGPWSTLCSPSFPVDFWWSLMDASSPVLSPAQFLFLVLQWLHLYFGSCLSDPQTSEHGPSDWVRSCLPSVFSPGVVDLSLTCPVTCGKPWSRNFSPALDTT